MKMNRYEFNKYYRDYIMNVNLDEMEFKRFTYKELVEFLKKYYYDEELNKFVYWQPDGFTTPFGMYYLDFTTYAEDVSYLLGLVNNSKGGKTIAFCMVYDNSYGPMDEVDNKVGYINTIETNYFFRNKGVLKKSLIHIRDIFSNHNLLVTSPESITGGKVSMIKRIRELFGETLKVIDEDEYFDSLAKRHKW